MVTRATATKAAVCLLAGAALMGFAWSLAPAGDWLQGLLGVFTALLALLGTTYAILAVSLR